MKNAILGVLAFLVVAAVATAFGWLGWQYYEASAISGETATATPPKKPKAKPKKEGVEEMPAVEVGVVPPTIRDGVPLVGPDGKDDYGYPTQTVDAAVIAAMLRDQQFDELDKLALQLQEEFVDNYRKEKQLHAFNTAFASADPELEPLLTKWVEGNPKSFAALSGRARHRLAVAESLGDDEAVAEKRSEALEASKKDARAAIKIQPRIVSAYAILMLAHMGLRDVQGEFKVFNEAIGSCKECLVFRDAHHTALTRAPTARTNNPARRFLDLEARRDWLNPAFAALSGRVDSDRCWALLDEGELEDAEKEAEQAIEKGAVEQGRACRATLRAHQGRYGQALSDLKVVLQLDPNNAAYQADAERFYRARGNLVGAATHLVRGLRLDPVNAELTMAHATIVPNLHLAARTHVRQGDSSLARSVCDRVDLLVTDKKHPLRAHCRKALTPSFAKNDKVGPLYEKLKSTDDATDLEAAKILAEALAKEKNWYAIASLWTEVLDEDAESAQAWAGRAEAWEQLPAAEEWLERDRARACELGDKTSCRDDEAGATEDAGKDGADAAK